MAVTTSGLGLKGQTSRRKEQSKSEFELPIVAGDEEEKLTRYQHLLRRNLSRYHSIITENSNLIKQSNLILYRMSQAEDDLHDLKYTHLKLKSDNKEALERIKILEVDNTQLRQQKEEIEEEKLRLKDQIEKGFQNYQNSLLLLQTAKEKI